MLSVYISVLFLVFIMTGIDLYTIKISNNKRDKIIVIFLWCIFLLLALLYCYNIYIINNEFNEMHKTINEIKNILNNMR